MEIQTRRQILDIWRATVDYSYRDGKWVWGGRSGSNSISDAEQLLTILYPATAIESLKLDSVDQTASDVLEYMRLLGNALDIPHRLVGFIGDYMRTYLVDGAPDFSGGSYFNTEAHETADIKGDQRQLHVVDSYSMSITLCLGALGFLQTYRQTLRSPRMLQEIDEIAELASQRLTAAMVGLLRSFTVNTFDTTDPPGQTMCKMINQAEIATETLTRDLLRELAPIRASLRQELSLGMVRQVADELDNNVRLFECGWSWGVIDGAPEIPFTNIGAQPVGVADGRPYMYFTVVAFDGIQDLISQRTRTLGLLNAEQQRLKDALQLRYELTRRFWATIAMFGRGPKWPLEDLPWTTSDGRESDYYSVLLSSIVLESIGNERVDVDVERVGNLLQELANRGRITRRAMQGDQAIELHMPGTRLNLIGSEKADAGPRLQWVVSSYSMLVLKRLLQVAGRLDDTATRSQFLKLADEIWRHIERRRINSPSARGLWDQPTQVFANTSFTAYELPSWYHTERVIEVLVAAANVTEAAPAITPDLNEQAMRLLAEAEHLLDRERLRGTTAIGEQMRERFQVMTATLRRASELLDDRPGTASVLAGDVLRELDTIDAARQDTARMT